jgi:hypothetical protein
MNPTFLMAIISAISLADSRPQILVFPIRKKRIPKTGIFGRFQTENWYRFGKLENRDFYGHQVVEIVAIEPQSVGKFSNLVKKLSEAIFYIPDYAKTFRVPTNV